MSKKKRERKIIARIYITSISQIEGRQRMLADAIRNLTARINRLESDQHMVDEVNRSLLRTQEVVRRLDKFLLSESNAYHDSYRDEPCT